MNIQELNTLLQGTILTDEVPLTRAVSSGVTCDLLSWVMAKGVEGCAWVTVQTHMNVIAVASLHDMACVILCENVEMEASVIAKAQEEDIAVIKTALPAYEICGRMYQAGIPASET